MIARTGIRPTLLLMAFLTAACGGTAGESEEQPATQPSAPAAAAQELACQPQRALDDRPSPYDSTVVRVGDQTAKVCYGRPAARGRQVFGGLVPHGELWRTGANEPTTIHIPFAATIAGVRVDPGAYSIYTIPAEGDWTVIVNRSTSQWGHPSAYTPDVEAQEVGRGTVPSGRTDEHVEQFTISTETDGAGANLILEWENTRVRIPIAPA